MATAEVPVNRTLIGVFAVAFGVLGIVTWMRGPFESPSIWTGAFLRSSIVLGAFWLALPSGSREAAWARVSLWKVLGAFVALIVVARSRVPFRILLPTAIIFAVIYVLLRPRPKQRPRRRA